MNQRQGKSSLQLCVIVASIAVCRWPNVAGKEFARSYAEGDLVRLKVNKLTSSKTQLPLDYYRLPFCQPMEGVTMDNQNLGEFLQGDRIERTPYLIRMKEDVYCGQLCISNVGRGEATGVIPNKMVLAVRNGYHTNWVLDNLPAASVVEDDTTITTRYWGGTPLGYQHERGNSFLHNHMNFHIMYSPVVTEPDRFQIVRFRAQPFSVRHDFEPLTDYDYTDDEDDISRFAIAKIKNPIASCNPDVPKTHTSYDNIRNYHQEASGKILFTYDVIWQEVNDWPNLKWANRWDIYQNMDNAIPARVHWVNFITFAVFLVLLMTLVIVIATRSRQRKSSRYDHLPTGETTSSADECVESPWDERVTSDTQGNASLSLLLLAVSFGTGAQLFGATLLTVVCASLGLVGYWNRGSLVLCLIIMFVLCGFIGGYATAWQYTAHRGTRKGLATRLTLLSFPGFSFGLFLVFDIMNVALGTTYAVPFATVGVLLFLTAVNAAFVFIGSRIGWKQQVVNFSLDNSSDAQFQLTNDPCCRRILVGLVVAVSGILPFGAIFVELYFMLASTWMGQYYSAFGFLLLAFVVLTLMIACTSALVSFFFFHINPHFLWYPFFVGGSVALYVFLYSILFYRQLGADRLSTFFVYFGFMVLVALALFLMMGFVGVLSSQLFLHRLFGGVSDCAETPPLETPALPMTYRPPQNVNGQAERTEETDGVAEAQKEQVGLACDEAPESENVGESVQG